ncbi:MAG: hypothetical protein MI919_25075, partial [Holophagales bacterium]|nr:hypothetical protein [Holophagales bacterium]
MIPSSPLPSSDPTPREGAQLRRPFPSAGICVLLMLAASGPRAAAQSPERSSAASGSPPIFVDATARVGLDFVHWNGMTGGLYMVEHTGGGGALLDYDRDGDLDFYVVQGHLLGPGKTLADARFPPPEGPLRDRLYRN